LLKRKWRSHPGFKPGDSSFAGCGLITWL